MFSFSSLLTASLIAMTSVLRSSASPAQFGCFVPPEGNYTFQSIHLTDELVRLGQPNAEGFTLFLEKAPPQGNVGTWTLTNADQGGYHITNVEKDLTVSTIQDGSVFRPVVATNGAPPTTYAIQCAGLSQFTIKAIDADLLWTTIPGISGASDPEQGVGSMQMLPSDGSDGQRFLLNML